MDGFNKVNFLFVMLEDTVVSTYDMLFGIRKDRKMHSIVFV